MKLDTYGQYASPYLGMGNNPVNRIDPDGGFDFYKSKETGVVEWYDGSSEKAGFEHLGVAYSFTDSYNNVTAWGESRFGSIVSWSQEGGLFHHNYNLDEVVVQRPSKKGGGFLRSSFVNVSFDKGSDNKINPKLSNYFSTIMKEASNNGINSVNISCTTNHPSNPRSAHKVANGARAFDMNYINGIHVSTNNEYVKVMQGIIQETPGWRENYGPLIIQKMNNGVPILAPWARNIKGGHYDHIHVSVPN